MTDQYTGSFPVTASVPARPAPRRPDTRQVRAAAMLFVALAAVGCLLGPLWAWWSPPGPLGERIPAGIIADETEAFIAADGRFALLTTVVGFVAAIAMWFARSVRGPLTVAALGLGGLLGAVLTDVVGRAVRGSTPAVRIGAHVYRIDHLPLQVHATGLLFLEGAAAVLGYGLFVAFTAHDDLGRPDPVRDALVDSDHPASARPGSAQPGSVQPGREPDDGGGDGDAASSLQEREFPPQ